MGRGAAPALARSSTRTASGLLLLVATFLLCVSKLQAHVCPNYCVCSVAMDSFHHVVCERASLDSIPRQVPSITNTTFLNMARNRITIIRERDLDDFKELQGLVLDHNKLNSIDKKAFHRCPRLTLLRLAHNNLRSLDADLFKDNPHLQFLDLSFNKLILLPKRPFLQSRSLVFLNLTATDLSVIPESAFADTPNIGHLELSGNLLAHVSARALDALVKRNVTVLLGGNPLRCDCALRRTWAWVQARTPAGLAPPAATCDQPAALRGRPWAELRRLECGDGGAGVGAAAHTSYVLYGIAGLLVVIAALVAAAVWGVRRRWRRRGAPGGGGGVAAGARRKHRLAPPVGEYIDVLGDAPPAKEPIYDALRDPPPKEEADAQRYVTDLARNTYLAPVRLHDDGPIYVNMKGPPLPLRRPSDVPPPPSEPAPPAPAPTPAPTPARPAQNRPCSIPLLEGCDFYEVVD